METTNRDSLREETAGELRALLARRRVSASELSRRLGWKQSYMARRIDGRVALDVDDLQAIANALQVSVLDLLPKSVHTGATSATMDRNSRLTERPTPTQHRPKDNRPTGHPSPSEPPGPRRTARVPRTARP
jgi:transcriptional regulator with XRE-family HTH domain